VGHEVGGDAGVPEQHVGDLGGSSGYNGEDGEVGTHDGGQPSVLGVQDSIFGGGGGACRIAPETMQPPCL
jgi:hypothetical protein